MSEAKAQRNTLRIEFRCTPQEKRAMRKYAQLYGMSLSQYLRNLHALHKERTTP